MSLKEPEKGKRVSSQQNRINEARLIVINFESFSNEMGFNFRSSRKVGRPLILKNCI